jgi:hypothetical protein
VKRLELPILGMARDISSSNYNNYNYNYNYNYYYYNDDDDDDDIGCTYHDTLWCIRSYLIHEAVAFNPLTKKWHFFPRRVSTERYDEELDEKRGSNTMITANEDFSKVEVLANIGVCSVLALDDMLNQPA